MSDIPVEPPKSILSILAEINSDMDTLSSELNRTLSIVEYKTQDRENDEMKELLNRVSQIVKEIDKMENIPKPIQVDKGIQSDQDLKTYNITIIIVHQDMIIENTMKGNFPTTLKRTNLIIHL